MSKTTQDPKAALAKLAKEYSRLIGKQDKASSFRRRMIYGRAQGVIRRAGAKTAREQDAAFDEWKKQANASPTQPAGKPAQSTIGNALID